MTADASGRQTYGHRRERLPRPISQPQPGSWRVRLHRHGPLIVAEIRLVHTTHEPGEPDNLMERSPFLAGFINNAPAPLHRVWQMRHLDAVPPERIAYERDLADWRRAGRDSWAKNEPQANPRRPVDWLTCKLLVK